jgi:hypothetical protein
MMVDNIEFQVDWPPAPPRSGQPLFDDTLGRLAIKIGPDAATKFRTDNNTEGDQIYIPTYHLAEWIASNWWPLLFEPAKGEDFQEDFDFRSRHWLGSARNGFALPDLWFCPAGEKMEIIGSGAHLRFARLTFLVEISEIVEIPVIRDALQKFVHQVISRLDDRGKRTTPLHEIWELIRDTEQEAEEYCQLIGSLGLSPYEEHPEIDVRLGQLQGRLDAAMIRDLCNASNEKTFPALAELAIGVSETLDRAQEADLTNLLSVPMPPDSQLHAWQWGLEAARRVRREFHISNADPEGGQQFLATLGLDSVITIDHRRADQVRGGLRRRAHRMHVTALDDREPQQRFTAARAAFLGWASNDDASHLVTTAITRDQRASRSFAAEIIAPIGYIRTRATNRVLSNHGIQEIAQSLNAPSGAVMYQARHGGIHVVGSNDWRD